MSEPLQPWYEPLIRALLDAQARNKAGHEAIATSCRAMAAHLLTVAEQHEALAASVPEGDQAAADLGTATDRHELNTLRTIVGGEQALTKEREAELHRVAEDIVSLGARVQELARQLAEALPPVPALPVDEDVDDPTGFDAGRRLP